MEQRVLGIDYRRNLLANSIRVVPGSSRYSGVLFPKLNDSDRFRKISVYILSAKRPVAFPDCVTAKPKTTTRKP
jgi:hypothetical protein